MGNTNNKTKEFEEKILDKICRNQAGSARIGEGYHKKHAETTYKILKRNIPQYPIVREAIRLTIEEMDLLKNKTVKNLHEANRRLDKETRILEHKNKNLKQKLKLALERRGA